MDFSHLLLNTAFSCMACDGEIAKEEVELIRNLAFQKEGLKNLNIDRELAALVQDINTKGKSFLKEYLEQVKEQNLSKEEELNVLQVAFDTIQADNKVEYSEVKFFKVIRSNMKLVSDEDIMAHIKGIDELYLAQDIKMNYSQLYDDYFSKVELKNFKIE